MHGFICGCVVDEYDVVVVIFLLGDGFEDFYVTVILDIVTTQDRNTESNLFADISVLIYFVFLDVLLILQLFNCVVLWEVDQLLAVD